MYRVPVQFTYNIMSTRDNTTGIRLLTPFRIDICISLAISLGLVSMLLFLSAKQLNGGIFWFLKTFLLILFGLMSYSCLSLVITFLMQFLVYFEVIFITFVFVVLVMLTNSSSHSLFGISMFGGGGMWT